MSTDALPAVPPCPSLQHLPPRLHQPLLERPPEQIQRLDHHVMFLGFFHVLCRHDLQLLQHRRHDLFTVLLDAQLLGYLVDFEGGSGDEE